MGTYSALSPPVLSTYGIHRIACKLTSYHLKVNGQWLSQNMGLDRTGDTSFKFITVNYRKQLQSSPWAITLRCWEKRGCAIL